MKKSKSLFSAISLVTTIIYCFIFVFNSYASNLNSPNASTQNVLKWFKKEGTNYTFCFNKECISLAKEYIDPDYILNSKTATFVENSFVYDYGSYWGGYPNNTYTQNCTLKSTRLNQDVFKTSFKVYCREDFSMGGGGNLDIKTFFTLNKVHPETFYCDIAASSFVRPTAIYHCGVLCNLRYFGEGYGATGWYTSTDSVWVTHAFAQDCQCCQWGDPPSQNYYGFLLLDASSHLGNRQIASGTWSVQDNTGSKVSSYFTGSYKRGKSSIGEETIIVSEEYIKDGSRKVAIFDDKTTFDLKYEIENHVCEYECVSITDDAHTLICSVCGKVLSGMHNFVEYDGIENDKCDICHFAKEINVTIVYNDDICDTEYIRASNSNIIHSRKPIRTGYDFLYWDEIDFGDDPPKSISTKSNATIIATASNTSKKYIANYNAHAYTFLLKENDDYNITFATTSVIQVDFIYDEKKKLPKNVFTKQGYNFNGWALYEGGNVIFEDEAVVYNYTATNSEIISFYPNFQKKYFTLKFIDGNSFSMQRIDRDQRTFYQTSSKGNFKDWYINGYKDINNVKSGYIFSLDDIELYDGKTFVLTPNYYPHSGNGGSGNDETNLSGKESNIINTIDNTIIEGKNINIDKNIQNLIDNINNKNINIINDGHDINKNKKFKNNINTKSEKELADILNNFIKKYNELKYSFQKDKISKYLEKIRELEKNKMNTIIDDTIDKASNYMNTNPSILAKIMKYVNGFCNNIAKILAKQIFTYPKLFKSVAVIILYFSLLCIIYCIMCMIKKLFSKDKIVK